MRNKVYGSSAVRQVGLKSGRAQAKVLFFVLVLCLAAACPANPRQQADHGRAGNTLIATHGDLQRRDDRYRLCASDSISITFPLTPEFNQVVYIEPDGFAALAGTASVHLEGLTTNEAATAIRAAYANVLRDPIISVELKDFNKPYFVVSGQVNKPGKYDLRGYTTAAEAVALAGGLNESAKHSQVLLFRRMNEQWYEVQSLNLKRILQGHNVNEDPQLTPGDMLFIPQNFISKIRRFIPSSGIGAYYQMHP